MFSSPVLYFFAVAVALKLFETYIFSGSSSYYWDFGIFLIGLIYLKLICAFMLGHKRPKHKAQSFFEAPLCFFNHNWLFVKKPGHTPPPFLFHLTVKSSHLSNPTPFYWQSVSSSPICPRRSGEILTPGLKTTIIASDCNKSDPNQIYSVSEGAIS